MTMFINQLAKGEIERTGSIIDKKNGITTILRCRFDLQASFHDFIGDLTSFIEHDDPFADALVKATNRALAKTSFRESVKPHIAQLIIESMRLLPINMHTPDAFKALVITCHVCQGSDDDCETFVFSDSDREVDFSDIEGDFIPWLLEEEYDLLMW